MNIQSLISKIKHLSIAASGNGQGSIITAERELRQAEKELLAKFDAYQRKAEAVEKENGELKKSIKILVCAFCGHTTERTDDHHNNSLKMAEHMMSCEKHPLRLMFEAENALLKKQVISDEALLEKFTEYFEVNEWTPESGFSDPLNFYIHEVWKRNPVVTELKKQVENLKCCGNCKDYKRIGCTGVEKEMYCDNWQSDNMTREARNDG